MTKLEALKKITEEIGNKGPVITSLGITTRLFLIAQNRDKPASNHFPVLSSMGSCLALAVGLARGLVDKKVTVVMGDGEFLMGINSFFTAARLRLDNLKIIVLNDARYAQSGGFSTAWKEIPMKNVVHALGFSDDNFLEMEISYDAKQEHIKRTMLMPKEVKQNFENYFKTQH